MRSRRSVWSTMLVIFLVSSVFVGCAAPAPTAAPAAAPAPTKAPAAAAPAAPAPTTAPAAAAPAAAAPAAAAPTSAPAAPAPTVPPATTAAPAAAPAAASGGELRYGLTLVVSGIDPQIHSSSELGIPLNSVYDTLVFLSSDYKFVPGLAESWQISDDMMSYTFKLRKDVKFHDGTPFNAAAVKANFDRIVDPATKSAKAITMMGDYKSTEVVDEFTAKVVFGKPFPTFLDSVAQVYLGMASPTALKKYGPADYQMHQVGTGPFMFSEKDYVPKDTIVLTKNPDYKWGPSIFKHTGPAYLDRAVFKFFPDAATRAAALESGAIDVIGELSPQDMVRLKADPKYQVIVVPVAGPPLMVFINSAKAPTDDLKVRQALLYATDRKAIVTTIFRGLSPVAYGPWGSTSAGFDTSLTSMYPYDLNKAKALLDEAGWKPGADGIRMKDGNRLSLDTYLQTWGFLSETGQILQAQLKMAGVDLKLQTVSFPAATEAATKGLHNLAPLNLSATDPSFLSALFSSKGGYNWSKFNNADMDKLIDTAAVTKDDATRVGLYQKVQKMAMDQALLIPIRDYTNFNGASAKVKGLVYDSHGWFPYLYDVSITK
jgi:peptide/nickel transport system substrate-binding protein